MEISLFTAWMLSIPGPVWGHVIFHTVHQHGFHGRLQKWPWFCMFFCIYAPLQCHFADFPIVRWNLFSYPLKPVTLSKVSSVDLRLPLRLLQPFPATMWKKTQSACRTMRNINTWLEQRHHPSWRPATPPRNPHLADPFVVVHSVVSTSLQPHGLQHTRLPCPSLSPRVCSNSSPLSWWCHPTISSSVIPFSSCLQSFPALGSSNESTLHIRWPRYWSFSFSISPSNEYSGLISFRINWFDCLAVQGTLKRLL